MQEDWDNLLILDACRYDIFSDCINRDGEIRKVVSAGSSTREFLIENFCGGAFPDTVYVSATPQIERWNISKCFHYSKHLWTDHWNDSLSTVTPETVADATMVTEDEYPNKRLIAHFIQPHYPFIGKTGQQIDHRGFTPSDRNNDEQPKIWHRLRDGDIDVQVVWTAYIENLVLSLPAVERLIDQLEGKTVITADHGNIFGKWGLYGHPHNRYLPELVEVPWFVPPFSDRKKIRKDGLGETENSDNTTVKDRLRDLGYRDI